MKKRKTIKKDPVEKLLSVSPNISKEEKNFLEEYYKYYEEAKEIMSLFPKKPRRISAFISDHTTPID